MIPTWSKLGPDMDKKGALNRHRLQTMLTQCPKFKIFSWSEFDTGTILMSTWSKQGPDMVWKILHYIDMFLGPC